MYYPQRNLIFSKKNSDSNLQINFQKLIKYCFNIFNSPFLLLTPITLYLPKILYLRFKIFLNYILNIMQIIEFIVKYLKNKNENFLKIFNR